LQFSPAAKDELDLFSMIYEENLTKLALLLIWGLFELIIFFNFIYEGIEFIEFTEIVDIFSSSYLKSKLIS